MQDEYWLTYAVSAFLENFWYVVVAIFGAVVGSFLGVVIYRLPIKELTDPELLPKGYSLSNPPSHCPHCQHVLESWENVPILGFLWLRGRCSDCKKAIPWRDFAMEILTACTWVAIFHRYNGNTPIDWVNVVLLSLFASLLIAAVFIDLDHFIVPEGLNRFGLVVGLLRDLLLLGLAFALAHFALPSDFPLWWNGSRLWDQVREQYTYFGWLPRGFVGAAVYGGALFAVSFIGFLYYARVPGESIVNVARRFFTYEDAPEPMLTDEEKTALAEEEAAAMAEEEAGPAIRLRFSPGFVTFLSAGFLSIVVGWWSLLAVALPLIWFIALTRTKTESIGDAFRRFFKADDLPYEYDAPSASLSMPTKPVKQEQPPVDEAIITGANVRQLVWDRSVAATEPPVAEEQQEQIEAVNPAPSFADSQAEADEFAREAETGMHGGMGLGDVKLALAIGAILGPGQAMLSLFFATLLGAGTGIALKFIHRKTQLRFGVPFVPFMAAGAFLTLLFGQQVVTWYTNFYAGNPQPIPNAVGPRVLPNGQVKLPSDTGLRRYRLERGIR